MKNAVPLLQQLIRRQSVNRRDDGCYAILTKRLEKLGFECQLLSLGADNPPVLLARLGTKEPNFSFAQHVDVVSANNEGWRAPPFSGEIIDNLVYGRGAVDMKGAIAAQIIAIENFLAHTNFTDLGSLTLIFTADEEIGNTHSAQFLTEWLKDKKYNIDHILVGEPTSQSILGDAFKPGRRGNCHCDIHIAAPINHKNVTLTPWSIYMAAAKILTEPYDNGYGIFPPSGFETVRIDETGFMGNIRFNPHWSHDTFQSEFNDRIKQLSVPAIPEKKLLNSELYKKEFFAPPRHVAYPEHGPNIVQNIFNYIQQIEDETEKTVIPVNGTLPNSNTNSTAEFAMLEYCLALPNDITQVPLSNYIGNAVKLGTRLQGKVFQTPQGAYTDLIQETAKQITHIDAEANVGGGTSDGRFYSALAPVVELGLLNGTMHKINEAVSIQDLESLTAIYEKLLYNYFFVADRAKLRHESRDYKDTLRL